MRLVSPLRFYRWAVIFPLALPVLAFPLIGGRSVEPPIPAVAATAMFVLLAGTLGAVPYGATAALLLLWMRDRSLSAVRLGLLVSPVLMFGVLTLSILALNGLAQSGGTPLGIRWLVDVGGLVLILGYGYIGIVLLVGRVLEHRDDASSTSRAAEDV